MTPLDVRVLVKHTKELLERNHRNVNSVGKPPVLLVTLKYMKESTLERHLMYISIGEKPCL
jgi:hypothetical protein